MARPEAHTPADPAQLARAAVARLKKISAKIAKGADLTADDLGFLERGSTRSAAEHSSALRSFDSIANAASALNIPPQLIKLAKKNGAPGFEGSRVYPEKLLPWLINWLWDASEHKEADKLEHLIRAEDLRKKRRHNDRDESLYVLKAELETFLSTAAERVKDLLRRRLKNQLPPQLVGLRADEISCKMDPLIADIIHSIRYCHGGTEAQSGTKKEADRSESSTE